MSYGPALPQHLQKQRAEESDSEEEGQMLGPRLPDTPCRGPRPEQDDEDGEVPMGPALPPHLRRKKHSQSEPAPVRKDESDDDDGDMIGPLPPNPNQSVSSGVARDFEARAERMRERLAGQGRSSEPQREQWMLELPAEKAKNFGLGPRQFSRSQQAPITKKDRAGWTETPEQRARRERGEAPGDDVDDAGNHAEDQDVLNYLAGLKRDQEMERISDDLSKKRGTESLMTKHSKKLKKAKEEAESSGAPAERRPFDRDVDLQANRFDNAQKEQMIKRAGQLNDRFSKGASKFL